MPHPLPNRVKKKIDHSRHDQFGQHSFHFLSFHLHGDRTLEICGWRTPSREYRSRRRDTRTATRPLESRWVRSFSFVWPVVSFFRLVIWGNSSEEAARIIMALILRSNAFTGSSCVSDGRRSRCGPNGWIDSTACGFVNSMWMDE